jgi:hypothetical protein
MSGRNGAQRIAGSVTGAQETMVIRGRALEDTQNRR